MLRQDTSFRYSEHCNLSPVMNQNFIEFANRIITFGFAAICKLVKLTMLHLSTFLSQTNKQAWQFHVLFKTSLRAAVESTMRLSCAQSRIGIMPARRNTGTQASRRIPIAWTPACLFEFREQEDEKWQWWPTRIVSKSAQTKAAHLCVSWLQRQCGAHDIYRVIYTTLSE